MTKSIEERIRQLESKKKSLQARLNKQKRAEDTRRKVLLGALLLDRMKEERINQWVKKELPGFLSREHDKKLFEDILNGSPSEEKQAVG